MEPTQTLFTLPEAAAYLQTTEAGVMAWVVRGLLPGAVIDGSMRFHRDHLDQFLKALAETYQKAMRLSEEQDGDAGEFAASPIYPLDGRTVGIGPSAKPVRITSYRRVFGPVRYRRIKLND